MTAERSPTPRPRAPFAWRPVLQLLPAGLLILVFFVLPLAEAIHGGGRYAEVFSTGLYVGVLLRTFELSGWVTLLCVVLGYPIAYLLTALRPRAAALFGLCILVPLFTAFLIRTYGWMILLGRGGVLNKALIGLGLIDTPLKILGTPLAVHIGMIHVLMPIAIFTMYSSMTQIDRSLMTAAQVLGATPTRAFTRVYLPLTVPGIVSAAVLVFIMAIGFFITPALLGGPGDTMISQLIVTQITTLLDLEFGYTLSVILLAATVAIVGLASLVVPIDQIWSPGRAQGAAGRGLGRPLRRVLGLAERLVHLLLGRSAWIVPVGLRVYGAAIAAFLLAPLIIVYVLSFSSSPFLVFPPPGVSLQWYEKFFGSADWREALFMSLRVGAVVATLSVAIGLAAAFALVRGRFPGKRLVFALLLGPLLVPVVVVALGLYIAMGRLELLGSFPGLVVGHMVVAVPYVVVILTGAVRNLDANVEHAAATLGAAPPTVLRRVVLPILSPALATAWVMAFLHSFDELLVTIFLLGRQTPTLPIRMWADIRLQIDPVLSAASSVIVTVVVLILVAIQYRRLMPKAANAQGETK